MTESLEPAEPEGGLLLRRQIAYSFLNDPFKLLNFQLPVGHYSIVPEIFKKIFIAGSAEGLFAQPVIKEVPCNSKKP
jgi:hypothetical protein